MKNVTLNPKLLGETDKVTIARHIASVIKNDMAAVIEVSPFPSLLESLADKVEKYLDREKENELIQELKQADKERDNAQLSMIYFLVSLVLRNDIPDIAQAANQLHSKTFPETFEFVQFNYDVETETINNILETLKTPDMKQLVESTNLSSYVQYAHQTQEAFINLQTKLQQFYDEIRALEILKQAVTDLEHILLAIFNMLETIYPLKNEDVQQHIKEMFEHINDITVKSRQE